LIWEKRQSVPNKKFPCRILLTVPRSLFPVPLSSYSTLMVSDYLTSLHTRPSSQTGDIGSECNLKQLSFLTFLKTIPLDRGTFHSSVGERTGVYA